MKIDKLNVINHKLYGHSKNVLYSPHDAHTKKETHVNVNSLVILGVHGSLLDSYQDLKFRFGIQIQHPSLT